MLVAGEIITKMHANIYGGRIVKLATKYAFGAEFDAFRFAYW